MPERQPLRTLAEFARKDFLLLVLLAALVALTAWRPDRLALSPALVDWHTVATLAGLMILTKGVELSGYLHRWGRHLIAYSVNVGGFGFALGSLANLIALRLAHAAAPCTSTGRAKGAMRDCERRVKTCKGM